MGDIIIEKIYPVTKYGLTFMTSLRTRGILGEDLSYYNCTDFKDKTVLDIGGFIGDTAVLFHSWGAKRIIIVEPVLENQPIIKENLKLHNISDADLFPCGIGEGYDDVTVKYRGLDGMFGLNRGVRENQRVIQTKPLQFFLTYTKIDIAKIDCEGAESLLLTTPQSTVSSIPIYLIETHTEENKANIAELFKTLGYNSTLINTGSWDVQVNKFEKPKEVKTA